MAAFCAVAPPLRRQLSFRNPNPTPDNTFRGRIYGAPSRLSCSSIPRTATVLPARLDPKRCIGSRFLPVDRRVLALLPLAVSKDDGSRHSNHEVGNHMDELGIEANESQKSSKKTRKCFKEGCIGRILFGNSKMGKVTGLVARAMNALIPFLKDCEEILFLGSTLKGISEAKDFFLGVYYGIFILFRVLMTEANEIWFSYIFAPGLMISVTSSFRSWKSGKSSNTYLKWQAVVAINAFLRELEMFSQNCPLPQFLLAVVSLFCSGAILLFYAYRIVVDSQHKGPSYEELVDRLQEGDVMFIDE